MSISISIREAVLVPGVLIGMDVEARCIVRAVKVSLPKPEISEYIRADIAQTPSELPMGEYSLRFGGRKMKVNKTAQGWISEKL